MRPHVTAIKPWFPWVAMPIVKKPIVSFGCYAKRYENNCFSWVAVDSGCYGLGLLCPWVAMAVGCRGLGLLWLWVVMALGCYGLGLLWPWVAMATRADDGSRVSLVT